MKGDKDEHNSNHDHNDNNSEHGDSTNSLFSFKKSMNMINNIFKSSSSNNSISSNSNNDSRNNGGSNSHGNSGSRGSNSSRGSLEKYQASISSLFFRKKGATSDQTNRESFNY